MDFGAINVCLLYLCLLLSLNYRICSALTTTVPVSFITEPSPSTVVFEYGEDRSVTIDMNCKVQNLKSDQKVSWLKGPDYTVISDDHVVRTHYLTDNDRYFIVGDESQGEYNLQIRMVSYQTAEFDSEFYHCAVLYDGPNNLLAIIRSAFARLNVYVVPRMMYPQCTVDDVNATVITEVTEDEAVTLSCQSDAGYPAVAMSWENGNSSTILTESVTVQDDKASVEYTWTPNENDDGVFFICYINHVAFDLPGGERTKLTCAVGPFKVNGRSSTRQSTISVLTSVTNAHVHSTAITTYVSEATTNVSAGDSNPTTQSARAETDESESDKTVIIAVICAILGVLIMLAILIIILICCVRKTRGDKSSEKARDNNYVGNPSNMDNAESHQGFNASGVADSQVKHEDGHDNMKYESFTSLEDKKQRNEEGLNYADLDFSWGSMSTGSRKPDDQEMTVYADIAIRQI